jgi:hypothetical protein
MTPEPRDLRERFETELRAARLDLSDGDRERLYVMWMEHLPHREALRAAVPAPGEEPYR